MIKWLVGTIAGVVIGIGLYFVWYLGALKPVTILEQTLPNMRIVFKDHTGPYHKIAPVITEVESWAKNNGLACTKSFGEYFDNPQQVEEGRLRSRGGCVLEDSETLPQNLPEGFKTEQFSGGIFVTAKFEGSPAIGPQKVYPKIEDYFTAKRVSMPGSSIEVYEVHSQTAMTTTYLFRLPTP